MFTASPALSQYLTQALILFLMGAYAESFLLIRPILGIAISIRGIFFVTVISLILAICIAVEKKSMSALTIIGCTGFIYMVLFGGMYFSFFLPKITKSSLLIFNVVFLYFLYVNGWRIDIYLLPSFAILLNAFITTKQHNSVRFMLYFWYLSMSSLMLVVTLYNMYAQLPISRSYGITTINLQSAISYFSMGMIALYFSLRSSHIIIPLLALFIYLDILKAKSKDYLRGNNTSGVNQLEETLNPKMMMKLYWQTVYAGYKNETTDMFNDLISLYAVIFILAANHYILHINNVIIVSAILLLTNTDFQPKRPTN